MKKALLLIDFVNENVSKDGKMAGKGYPNYCEKYNVLDKAEALLTAFRNKGHLVIHVRVGFSPDYKEQPLNSPLFGAANKFGAFKIGAWGDDFYGTLAPLESEAQYYKHRVSAFYGTPVELLLKNQGIEELYICGVATDLAVQAATRDAHDRDISVTVVEDCCGAANENDHRNSLITLAKIAKISTLEDVLKTV